MTDIVEFGRNMAAVCARNRLPQCTEGFSILTDEIQRLRAQLKTANEGHESAVKLARMLDGQLEALDRSHKDLASKLAAAGAERDRLREALRRYGDRGRMCWAPDDLQPVIDDALSEKGERWA